MKSGDSATQSAGEGSLEGTVVLLSESATVNSREEVIGDSLREASGEAMLFVILWEWLSVLRWTSSGCGRVTRCVRRWEGM